MSEYLILLLYFVHFVLQLLMSSAQYARKNFVLFYKELKDGADNPVVKCLSDICLESWVYGRRMKCIGITKICAFMFDTKI